MLPSDKIVCQLLLTHTTDSKGGANEYRYVRACLEDVEGNIFRPGSPGVRGAGNEIYSPSVHQNSNPSASRALFPALHYPLSDDLACGGGATEPRLSGLQRRRLLTATHRNRLGSLSQVELFGARFAEVKLYALYDFYHLCIVSS